MVLNLDCNPKLMCVYKSFHKGEIIQIQLLKIFDISVKMMPYNKNKGHNEKALL